MKKGQRLICINDDGQSIVKRGEIYTVKKSVDHRVYIEEHQRFSYLKNRFLVLSEWTDISINPEPFSTVLLAFNGKAHHNNMFEFMDDEEYYFQHSCEPVPDHIIESATHWTYLPDLQESENEQEAETY